MSLERDRVIGKMYPTTEANHNFGIYDPNYSRVDKKFVLDVNFDKIGLPPNKKLKMKKKKDKFSLTNIKSIDIEKYRDKITGQLRDSSSEEEDIF